MIDSGIKDFVFHEMKKDGQAGFEEWYVYINDRLFNFYVTNGCPEVIPVYWKVSQARERPAFFVSESEDGSYELLRMMG